MVETAYINIKKENTSRPTELRKMEEKVQEINMSFVQSAKKNKKGEMNWLIPSFGTNIKKVMIKRQSSIITFRET